MSNIESSDIKNRTVYFGDNLDILKEKFKNEGGYFDLIYLDPPFNSKRNYNQIFEKKGNKDTVAQAHAFEDSWRWGDEAEQAYRLLTSDKGIDISIQDLMTGLRKILGITDMMAYLIMMTSRLVELRRVLKPNGSIYLHCDPHASHYLKIVMDIIFGYDNFRNEIVWHYGLGAFNRADGFPSKHDIIFFYSKSKSYIFNKLRGEISPAMESKYCHEDKDGKYMMSYGKKYYLKGGKPFDDVWEIPTLSPSDSERRGYPTQKPEALLERIIKASSNEGDWVLDPFVGCGTCVSVSEKLHRNWVGIDITPLAVNIIKNRMAEYYPDIKIGIDGLPKDMEGARMLAEKCGEYDKNGNFIENGRFDFQYWSLSLLNAMPFKLKIPTNKKRRGKDSGIDGIIKFENQKNEIERLIISVKSGKKISVDEIRDLKGVIEREKAAGGLYITLYEPTKDMVKEAVVAGTYSHFYKDIQKIQIVKVEDLLNGKMPDIPSTINPYKEAQEVKVPEKTTQSKLIRNAVYV